MNVRNLRKGFTLVELAVVIIIIGVLAAFAVPRFLNSVERSKSAEAFNYLSAVRAAQERYQVQNGTYANDVALLDIQMPAPKYFTVGATVGARDVADITAAETAAGTTLSLENSWKLTLTRTGDSAGYGAYTVTFTDQGYDEDATDSTIPDSINPMARTAS